MEDLHLVENRGSGVSAMLEAMRQANITCPEEKDCIQIVHKLSIKLPENGSLWEGESWMISIPGA